VEPGFGREPVEYLLFRDGGEPSVAGQAAREGGGGAGEVEPPDDLRELLTRVRPVDGGGVGQLPPLEEPAVARKEDPPLAERQRNELLVGGVAPPDRVEAEQAEPARQLPEVDVKDEARLAERPRAEVTGPWLFTGVQCATRRLLDLIPPGRTELARDVLVPSIARGERAFRLVPCVEGGFWFDLGTPARMAMAEDRVRG